MKKFNAFLPFFNVSRMTEDEQHTVHIRQTAGSYIFWRGKIPCALLSFLYTTPLTECVVTTILCGFSDEFYSS